MPVQGDRIKATSIQIYKKVLSIAIDHSTHITSWHLHFTKFVEQLQVLSHGVNAVWWGKESFRLGSKHRRQFGDAGTKKGLHELFCEIPAFPWNHTGAVLHL